MALFAAFAALASKALPLVAKALPSILGIGGALASGKSSSKASSAASDAVLQAQREALAVSSQRYGEFQQAIQPYLVGGGQAYNTLLGQYGIPTGARGATAAPQAPRSDINIPQFGVGAESGFGSGMFGDVLNRAGEQIETSRRAAGRGFPEAGAGGITPEIPSGPTDLSQTPAFQIPFNVGIDRARQDLASQGLLFSGPAIQEYQDQSFGAYYNNLLAGLENIAGGGLSAATNFGTIGQGQAGQTGNILSQGGVNQANLALGQGISRGNTFADIAGSLGDLAAIKWKI